jgi:hypothetical protein
VSETGVDLTAFDPLDPATQQCPFPHYAAMRAQGSVFEADVLGRPVYLVTRHEALEELTRRIPAYRLADTNTFAYEPSFMLRGLQRPDLLIR